MEFGFGITELDANGRGISGCIYVNIKQYQRERNRELRSGALLFAKVDGKHSKHCDLIGSKILALAEN